MDEFKLSFTANEIDERLKRIDNLAAKSELPKSVSDLVNDSDFTTKKYVQDYAQPIGDYLTEIPKEYITEFELNKKGYLTEHQSLEGLATEEALAQAKQESISTSNTYTDEQIYQNMANIPTVPTKVSAFTNDADYASKEYVRQKISDIETTQYKNLCSIGSFTFVKTSNYTNIGSTLEPGKTYTLSADITSNDTDSDTCCFYLCTSESTMANPKYVIARTQRASASFVCPDDGKVYSQICLYAANSSASSVNDTATFANIQIEEGSVATDYIPYGITVIPAIDRLDSEVNAIANKKPLPANLSTSDFEIGSITEAGNNSSKQGRIRTRSYVYVSDYTSIEYNVPNGYRVYFVFFSTNNTGSNVGKAGWLTGAGRVSIPENAKYYRVQYASVGDETALTVNDYSLFEIGYSYPALTESFGDFVTKTKWLAVGDSITRGVYSYMNGETSTSGVGDGWVRKLASALGYDITVMASRGMGYTSTVTGQDPLDSSQPRISLDTLLTRIEALTDDFNLITLAFGINDYNTPSSTTLETITAGLDDAIERLMAKFQTARLVVITPFNSCRVGDATTNYAYKYTQGDKSLKDIAEAIKTRCESYGVECVYASNGFLINNFNIETLLPDKVHPSDMGHSLIAKNMAHYLLY